MEMLLAGDIGGTNTRLALFSPEDPHEPQALRVYRSGDYESLVSILLQFFSESADVLGTERPRRAVFAVAGPVDDMHARLTNIPWVLDARQVSERAGIERVRLINDFQAQCYAVTHLQAGDVHPLGAGREPKAQAPIAVLGAGTGLGEGFLVPDGQGYLVVASEGGHKDYAPRSPLEMRLLTYLLEKYDRVSWERVVSGNGLVNVYEFLRDRENMPEAPAVRERMRHEDAPKVISTAALAHEDALCERALDLFCSNYGAEAGNLALEVLARGGVYLTGGIARAIIPRLEGGDFRFAFEHKGRHSAMLQTIPTYIVTHDHPGLVGTAVAATEI